MAQGTSGLADPGDLLVMILDINPLAWAESARPLGGGDDNLSLEDALEHVLIFANAHMALRDENELAVFAAGVGTSELLYSSSDSQGNAGSVQTVPDPNTYQQFRTIDEKISQGVKRIVASSGTDPGTPIGIVGALSKALCHVNRLSKDENAPSLRSRLLVLSVSADASSQYIPIMNCIFSAQKSSIPIDVCKIFGEDTVFLQQAAHLTSASYYRLERRAGLLQYLMVVFLPGRAVRRHLNLPSQDEVDLRAACFCHRNIVDIGYVCSVCLSIFCAPRPVCTTCRTKFPIATLRRLGGPGGVPRPAANGASRGQSPAVSTPPAR